MGPKPNYSRSPLVCIYCRNTLQGKNGFCLLNLCLSREICDQQFACTKEVCRALPTRYLSSATGLQASRLSDPGEKQWYTGWTFQRQVQTLRVVRRCFKPASLLASSRGLADRAQIAGQSKKGQTHGDTPVTSLLQFEQNQAAF